MKTVNNIIQEYGFESIWEGFPDREVSTGFTSDLLSDVMGNSLDGAALITIQAHKNSIAVASLAGLSCIIICSDRPIPEDMIEAAKKEDIPLLRTKENQYTVSWKLHKLLEG